MITTPDKSQRPQTASPQTCPRCQGEKTVQTSQGKVPCPACRGTGQGTKGYMTK